MILCLQKARKNWSNGMRKMFLVFMLFLLGIANSVLVQKKIITTNLGILGVSVGCASETKDIDVSPVIIDFGDVNIGTNVDRLVSVTNNLSVNLNLFDIIDPSSPFSIVVDTCSAQSIAPSDNCNLVIRFSPNSVGTFNDTVQIPPYNTDVNSILVSLNGTSSALAEPALTVNPTSVTRILNCQQYYGIQFEAIGKDQDEMPIELGTITWSVQGGIGSINQNGKFHWNNVDATGTVTAISSHGGLIGTTGSMTSRYFSIGVICPPATDPSLKGTVYPNIPTTIITNAGEKAIVGYDGVFTWDHIPGFWQLWAQSDGYEDYNMDFHVIEGQERNDKIYLTPKPPSLDPVISASNIATLAISGLKAPMTSVWLNGLEIIPQNAESVWSYTIQLSNGLNTIDLTSKVVSSSGIELESSIRSYSIEFTPIPIEFIVSSPLPSNNVTEQGETATITVQLSTQPTADIIIPVISSDETEGTVSPSSLTFTSTNWGTPKTVTIIGVNDFMIDGDQFFTVQIGPTSSIDTRYNGLAAKYQSVTNIDDDQTLEEAVDLASISLSTGGNTNWEYQTAVSHFDGDAAQSGNILDNQTSYMQTTISGPKVLRFFWKVSSESGSDYLKFYIDGEQQAGISGEVNWTEQKFMIKSGSHTLKWAYEKGFIGNHGSDLRVGRQNRI